ncbi:cobalamin biosynthesis protein CbiG [Methanocalculus chunghsingensis]|uniref:Cobalamin biosynthesis protein CbiG n=1 Tax=Methanocalculus chunghsingensis TaxID=156457 RepID=A0A8J7W7R8_9EURY|nr:cobalt-precorrin 5A hydrolase [Methanocalculus chunghsingensis]MBR1369959.1 cobalamin biosynthesis protein CbiG [Methanocalculus chunghsingensis]
MKIAVITLPRFRTAGEEIAEAVGGDLLMYDDTIFERAFAEYNAIIAVMSAGIAVRSSAPLLRDKWHDPAVIVVSPDCRYAIPVLGGHHGGNEIATRLSELGITPVITTATEVHGRPSVEGIADKAGCRVINRPSTRRVNAAFLDGDVPLYEIPEPGIVIAGPGVSVLIQKRPYMVGIGARRGITAAEVVDAVRSALSTEKIRQEEIGAYVTTEKKRGDPGLAEGIAEIGGVLIYLDDETINRTETPSPSRAGLIGLSGVAEPCAVALAEMGRLVMKKKTYGRVTIAIGR